MSSRLRGVSIFTIARKTPDFGEPPASSDDVLSKLSVALARAGCAFLPKMLVSPRRHAHLTYPHFQIALQYQIEPLFVFSSPIFSSLRRRRFYFAFFLSDIFLLLPTRTLGWAAWDFTRPREVP